jgi:glutaredoxin-like protein NrdH
MMLEAQALDLYTRYAQKVEDAQSRSVLHGIAEEEKGHLAALGSLMEARTWKEKRRILMESKVKIYSLSTCSHCKSTKKLLDECSVKYEFTDVDMIQGEERTAILDDVRKLNPRCSFPTIIINDKVIVGYKENEIKEALGLLWTR